MDSLLRFVATWLLAPNVLVSFAVAAIVIVLRAWSWLALGVLNLVVLLGIPFTGRHDYLFFDMSMKPDDFNIWKIANATFRITLHGFLEDED